jgi:glycosyltransferase involved in cell wall biosynthesis
MTVVKQASSTSRTRVLINLTWLVPGVVGGSEESTTDALRAIAADPPADLEIHLAVLKPFLDAHPDLVEHFAHHVLAVSGRNKVRRVLAEQGWLARLTKRIDAQVVHHAGGVVPLLHPGRVVLTIHDLQPLDLAHNFSATKRMYLRLMLGRSAKAAAVICVPSEFTAGRVEQLLGVKRDRLRVVPWCLSQSLDLVESESELVSNATAAVAVSKQDTLALNLPGKGSPYFLYPAVTYAHKNHLMLLQAFAQLKLKNPEVSLVLTGAAGPLEEQVNQSIHALGLSESVYRTGRIGSAQLDELVSEASAVVLPSLYEGFGLPALEAMAQGCLVLGSKSGSLPEVLQSENLLDPKDLTAWADAMQSVLVLTDSQRTERIKDGLQRAATFTPERTARALCDSYLAAANEDRADGVRSHDG